MKKSFFAIINNAGQVVHEVLIDVRFDILPMERTYGGQGLSILEYQWLAALYLIRGIEGRSCSILLFIAYIRTLMF